MTTVANITVWVDVGDLEALITSDGTMAFLSCGAAANVIVRSADHKLGATELATLLRHLANDLDRRHRARPDLDLVPGDGPPL